MSISVVIIEDQKEIREMLGIILNGTDGYSCLAMFENAEDAMEAVADLSPDVALVDIHLPDRSGIEFISKIKTQIPATQFLMYTSLEDSEHVFNALKAGAHGYITKSTPPAKLLEAITEVYNGGSPMNSNIARKVVATFQPAKNTVDHAAALTNREKEILEYISQGYRYKEVAAKLFISIDTVRTHIRNIYEKLQVNSSIEALNKVFPK